MTRVATIPMQRNLFDAIQRSQEKLSQTQIELSTGKKAQSYSDLGTEAVRNLTAHSLVAQQEAQSTVDTRLQTTLSLYDTNISSIEQGADDLRTKLLTAIGTGDAAGLQDAIELTFQQVRNALNANEGGVGLFGGSNISEPAFKPDTLADTVGLNPADAFANDDVHVSARVSDGLDITYGVTASELGTKLVTAFRTLAEAGTISEKPSATQLDAMQQAVSQIADSLVDIRSINAENGRKQAQVDTLSDRSEQRTTLLKTIISQNEDADLGQVASDLTIQQSTLQASYSVFSKLSSLSLVDYL